MSIPSFLKKDKYSILFNGDGEFIFYVPELYFKTNKAIIVGEYVNLLGILDYAVFDKNGKSSGLKRFNFPTVFLSRPTTIEKVKQLKLTNTSEVQDYRLLRFSKGDQIVVSTKVPQDLANTEEFYSLFLGGNLPTTIPYNELHNYFPENVRLNGASYNLNMQIFGVVISESFRDPKDLSKPFRLSKETDMTNYKAINIKTIPKLVSPHSSITSENWDEAVVNAVLNTNVKDSPMEKILMD